MQLGWRLVLREWETIHTDRRGARSSFTSASSRAAPTTTWPSFTGASTGSRQGTGAPSTSAGPGSAAEGPSTEPYTPMPLVFSHASFSQFQSPMTPPTEGFFAGAFQPYSSMVTAPLHSPRHFFPPLHQLHTSVTPLSVYPPQGPDFGSNYGMVQHTPPGSLFASGPSGSSHHVANDEYDDDDDALVRRNPRRNPRRNRHAPGCGTGGHRRH
ncbi:hypothetical protein V6N13_059752 [Hibiscus sabdariffa]